MAKFLIVNILAFNPLSAGGISTVFYGLIRAHKGAWVAALHSSGGVQDYKLVKFPGRDNSSLAVKGLIGHRNNKSLKIIN